MNSDTRKTVKDSLEKFKKKNLKNSSPSSLALLEEQDLQIQSLKEEVKNKNLKNVALEGVIKLREKYAEYIFNYLIFWTIGVAILLFLSSIPNSCFIVKESTMNILIGATFGNVLALVGVVAKGLFIEPK